MKSLSAVWVFAVFSSVAFGAAPVTTPSNSEAGKSSPNPLFAKGIENFKIQDKSGKTPQFRVLDDGLSEQALALGIIAALNAQETVQPKIPVREFIDLKFESMKVEPLSEKELAISLKLSGYEMWIEKTIDKVKFLLGETIEIKVPESEKQIAMYNVTSSGKVKMRLNKMSNEIIFDDVSAKMNFTTPLGDDGSESVKFSGKGIRL